MTLEEYHKRMRNYGEALISGVMEGVVVSAHNVMLADIINRIELDGKTSDGKPIGSYSKEEGWYTRDEFLQRTKFRAVGKRREKTKSGAVGKRRKKTKSTMYLSQGYYELREMQGLPVETVNLAYTRDTNSRLRSHVDLSARTAEIGFSTEHAALVAEGNEEKYGAKIYTPGDQEMAKFAEEVIEGIREVAERLMK